MTHRPEDHDTPDERSWLELEPQSVSPGFVDRTLERVMADRDEPWTEPFPPGFLEAYDVPEPSPDFVDRVAAAAAARRIDEGDLRELLRTYEAPEPSPDFVARTLNALRSDLQALPRVPARRVGSLLPAALLLAALIVASLVLWPRAEPSPSTDGLRSALHAAWQPDEGPRYSPNAAATLFSRSLYRSDTGAPPVVIPDRLLALAQQGDE